MYAYASLFCKDDGVCVPFLSTLTDKEEKFMTKRRNNETPRNLVYQELIY